MNETTGIKQFRGEPTQLYTVLRAELFRVSRGTWVRRQLSRGAVVSLMRRVTDGRRMLIISRDGVDSDGARRQFERECFTIAGWLSATKWDDVEHETLQRVSDALTGIEDHACHAYIEPGGIAS